MPAAIPVDAPIVPTAVLLLLHVPPVVVLDIVVVIAVQNNGPPVFAVAVITFTEYIL
jgi:hypothetical protein